MKLITKLSTAIAFFLVSLSSSVFAQPGTPVTCVWTTGTAYNTYYRLCHDGSVTGPVAASEVVVFSNSTCTVYPGQGYSATGPCGSTVAYKLTPPPTTTIPAACPNDGAIYPNVILVGSANPPFPTATIQAFCGDVAKCQITTETVSYISPNSSVVRAICRSY